MTPQELKNSILQLAIQGKLGEQRPEDGTAAELLDKILAATTFDKSTVVKKNAKGAKGNLTQSPQSPQRGAKTSRTSRTSREAIPDDEKPFDIPESWEWVRLGDMFNIVNGFTPLKSNPEFWANGDIPWFTINDVHRQGRFITTTEKHITKKALAKGSERIVPSDTVLLCCTASIGEYAFTKIPLTTNQQFNALVVKEPYQNLIDPLFVLEFVKTLKGKLIELAGKTTFNFVSVGKVSKILFPLPPLAEQKRIVAKIEELLPLIDRYEKAWSKLEDFNRRFPVDMQKSVLQMAIQGKFVDQRPEEGTGEELYRQIQVEKQYLVKSGKIKKEKPLPEITEDEIPFEIPDSWKWVRLGKIVYGLFAGGDKPSDFVLKSDSIHVVPVVGNGITNDGILGYTEKATAKARTITVAGRGTIGFSLYREYEYCPVVRLIVIEQSSGVFPKYLQFVLQGFPEKSLGTSIPQLTVPMLSPKMIPLPPLAEQKRIVAKLEEILPLCERLK